MAGGVWRGVALGAAMLLAGCDDDGGGGGVIVLDATAADTGAATDAADTGGATDATTTDATDATTTDATDATADAAPAACPDGAILCDDFESAAAPDPARWTTTSPNCSGAGSLALDAAVARGAGHSVRVTGGGGYCDHVFLAADLAALAGGPVHARFWVRLSAALGDGHTTFVAMRDTSAGKDVRVGGQAKILMWNRETDDATLPVLSPAGIALSRPLPAETWTCVELAVDGAAGTIATWVDDVAVPGLVVDGTATADIDEQWLRQSWHPTLASFGLGWESYAGQALTLWFDDVVIARDRIGCGLAPRDAAALPAAVRGTARVFGPPYGPLGGARVEVLEHPELGATTDADGTYVIPAVPPGDVTLVLRADGYPENQLGTQCLAGRDLEGCDFQAVPAGVFDVFAILAGAEPDPARCQIATTVTRWFETALPSVHGEPGATVSIAPASDAIAAPVYFSPEVLPSPGLAATSVDGGVVWTNVPPGDYVLSAHKPGVAFDDVRVRCRAGVLVNAAPPRGLQARTPGGGY